MRSASSSAVLCGTVLLAVASFSGRASPKPKKGDGKGIGAIEVRVAKLQKSKDARADFDDLSTWLGSSSGCGDACDELASFKWASANLDDDPEEEKILAVTMRGAGACAPATVHVLALDPAGGGEYALVGHEQLELRGVDGPDLSFAAVHQFGRKDLVVSASGKCASERLLRVYTMERGRLEELAASDEAVGRSLTAHAFVGGPPAAIELTTPKGVVKLAYDPEYGYGNLPSYAQIKKDVVSASDDNALSSKECTAPLGTQLALDCGLSGSAKIEVMVQHGKAIGLTVTSTPVSRAFGRCVRKKLASASWKSLAAPSGCTRTFAIK